MGFDAADMLAGLFDAPAVPAAAALVPVAADAPPTSDPADLPAIRADSLSDAPEPKPCPRCGGRELVEVEIHGGQSARIDCRRCHRFVRFGKW